MNLGILKEICQQHDAVLVDTSVLRYWCEGTKQNYMSQRQYARMCNEYSRYMLNCINDNKNIMTVTKVTEEIRAGLHNLKGRNRSDYRETYSKMAETLQKRVCLPADIKFSSEMEEYSKRLNLSSADSQFIAFLLSSKTKTAGLSNDLNLLYAAMRIGGNMDIKPILYRFNGLEFVNVSLDYLIHSIDNMQRKRYERL